jgi:ABC-2 type transport system ATP-binding protein
MIFLDEPTSGLDPVAAAGLREELAALVQREGITVFLTTHNLFEAEKLCSRVAVIHNGKLLAKGTPAEIRATTGSKTASLEDAFLNLVKAEQQQ